MIQDFPYTPTGRAQSRMTGMKVSCLLMAVGLAVSSTTSQAVPDHVRVSANVTDIQVDDPTSAPAWALSAQTLDLDFVLAPDSLSLGPFGFAYSAVGDGNLVIDSNRQIPVSFISFSLEESFTTPGQPGLSLSGGGALPDLPPSNDLQYLSLNLGNSNLGNISLSSGLTAPLALSQFDLGGELVIGAYSNEFFQPIYQVTARVTDFSINNAGAPVPEPATYGTLAAGLLIALVAYKRLVRPATLAGPAEG